MEAATGKEVSRLAHHGPVDAVAFSPDGKWVATGSGDKTARVMEAATGKEVSRLAHYGTVHEVAFSPDGKWLATASVDNTARVMEAATGKEVSRRSHQGIVNAVAFSPDGKWLATGSEDNTARVMEAATGKELIRHQMNGPIISVSFLGNSSLVVASRTSSTLIEISHIIIDPTELIRDACSRLPRNLTREEWDRYLHGESYRATCPNLPKSRKQRSDYNPAKSSPTFAPFKFLRVEVFPIKACD